MKHLSAVVLLVAALAVFPVAAFAAPVAVDTVGLSQADPTLDGQSVQFSGEAIGETLRASGETRWVNVLDNGTAIGVVAPTSMLQSIDGFGDWSQVGTRIEVTGVFNVACDEHGGDLDVHATEIRVLAPAREIPRPISTWKIFVSVAILAAFAALVARLRYVRHHSL